MAASFVATGQVDARYGDELTLERPGARLHVWRRNPDGRSAILFTHGAGLDHELFAPQVDALAGDHQVVTWDVRGHGATGPLTTKHLSPDDAVGDMVALLDACGLERAVLAGQSMGGNFSQRLVRAMPDRAAALVVIDSARNSQPLRTSERLALPVTGPMLAAWPWGNLKRLSVKGCAVTPGGLDYARRCFDAMSKHDFVEATMAATGCLDPDPSYRVPVPLLLFCGDHDRLGSIARHFEQWRADEPDASAHQVPDAGHLSNLDNADFVNDTLVRFLSTAL